MHCLACLNVSLRPNCRPPRPRVLLSGVWVLRALINITRGFINLVHRIGNHPFFLYLLHVKCHIFCLSCLVPADVMFISQVCPPPDCPFSTRFVFFQYVSRHPRHFAPCTCFHKTACTARTRHKSTPIPPTVSACLPAFIQ